MSGFYMEIKSFFGLFLLLGLVNNAWGDQNSFDDKVKVLEEQITTLNHNALQVKVILEFYSKDGSVTKMG